VGVLVPARKDPIEADAYVVRSIIHDRAEPEALSVLKDAENR
jgi:hypothetical protein